MYDVVREKYTILFIKLNYQSQKIKRDLNKLNFKKQLKNVLNVCLNNVCIIYVYVAYLFANI